MSASGLTKIRQECDKFCRFRGIKDAKQKDVLQKLALRSYYAMPAKNRGKWSLSQIILQDL